MTKFIEKILMFVHFGALFCSFASAQDIQILKSAKEVLGQDVVNQFTEVDLNMAPEKVYLPKIKLIDGLEIDHILSPWAVTGKLTQVLSYADLGNVNAYLQKKGLYAVDINGKALIGLYFLDYQDSGAGPYTEFVIGLFSQRSKNSLPVFADLNDFLSRKTSFQDDVITFVDHLTLGGPTQDTASYQTAIWAGRTYLSYPKYFGQLRLSENSSYLTVGVSQPESEYYANWIERNKAGSFNIDVKITLAEGFSLSSAKYKKYPASVNYYALENRDQKSHCETAQEILTEMTMIESTSISIKLWGNSSSLEALKAFDLEPIAAFHANKFDSYIFLNKTRGQNCGPKFGLAFDVKAFFPKDLLSLQK